MTKYFISHIFQLYKTKLTDTEHHDSECAYI